MTQYDAWLNTLGGRRADLPSSEHVRGLSIRHSFEYPDDITDATLVGTVKIAPDAETELATFTIGAPVFSNGFTRWEFSLSGADTSALPSDENGDGVEIFIYDLLLTLSGGEPVRVAGGLFPLSGFVTEAA